MIVEQVVRLYFLAPEMSMLCIYWLKAKSYELVYLNEANSHQASIYVRFNHLLASSRFTHF
jgi:hypothetical protein